MRNVLTRHTGIAVRTQVVLLASALSLSSLPALAQATPERMSDKEVKALIEQVDTTRDKFEGNLDGKLKDSTLRSATGEVNVSSALQDYQDNVKKLMDRFTEDYSASAEVTTVLKQAANIEKFMKDNPSVTKGRSEWEHHVTDLKRLATVYGTTFPVPEGAGVRRMNDKEVAGLINDIANAADHIKTAYDDMPVASLPKADKEAGKKDLELLEKRAETAKSRIEDHKPATAEVRQVVAQVAVVQKFVTAHPDPKVTTNWDTAQTALGKLQLAFGLTK